MKHRPIFISTKLMRSKRGIMITPEGGYYLFVMAFVFTGAVLREINLMLVLAGMMLGPLVYNARTARRMIRNLTVRRRLPDAAMAGEPVTVELVLRSKTRFAGVNLVDRIQRVGRAAPSISATGHTAPAAAQPGEAIAVRYTVVAEERGEYRFGPLQVRSAYPFGLIRRSEQHDLSATLVVFPRLGRLTDRWSALAYGISHDRSGSRRQTYSAGDFYGLRDYRSGDTRRHIHWRTSARRGKLTVRQFERALHQDVAIFLDPWQPAVPTDADRQHAERAISFAATLVHDLSRRDGCRLCLTVAGDRADPLQGTASAGFLREAMVRLARAEAGRYRINGGAAQDARARMPRGALHVLVSSRPNAGELSDAIRASNAGGESRSGERLVCLSSREPEFGDLFVLESQPQPQPQSRDAIANERSSGAPGFLAIAAEDIAPQALKAREHQPAAGS